MHLLDNPVSTIPKNLPVSRDDLVDGYSLEDQGLGDKGHKIQVWTEPELRFLVTYLKGGITIDKAMISGGYGDISPNHRNFLAEIIVKWHERSGEDKAETFRDIVLGEEKVAELIEKLVEKGRSEVVKLITLAPARRHRVTPPHSEASPSCPDSHCPAKYFS